MGSLAGQTYSFSALIVIDRRARSSASTFASDSVLVRTKPGFPVLRPTDFPGLKAGIYSLKYGERKTPRRAVKLRERRITRSTSGSVEGCKLCVLPALDALLRHIGFNGLRDRTTEMCLGHIDSADKDCQRAPEIDWW